MESRLTKRVQDWLRERRFPSEASVLFGPQFKSVSVFVPASVVARTKKLGRTSYRHMSHLRRLARHELSLEVDFRVIADDKDADIEAGLSAHARQALADRKVNAFLASSTDGTAEVWLDAKCTTATDIKTLEGRLHTLFGDYLEKFGLSLHRVVWQGGRTPSSLGILRALKIVEPATLSELSLHLVSKGYPNVPERWLRSQLDGVRKRGLVSWHDDHYVITVAGLSLLPQSRGRASSDVERALALARRRWHHEHSGGG